MKETRMLLFLTQILRAMGLFPYRFSHEPAAATSSWGLLVYCLGLSITFWTLIVVTLLDLIKLLSFFQGTFLVAVIFSKVNYIVLLILVPLYFLLCSRKFAKALASLVKFHSEQLCRFTTNQLDKCVFFQLFYVLFSTTVNIVLSRSIYPDNTWITLLKDITITSYYSLLSLVFPMFYNALFRLLSIMLAAAFTPIEQLYGKHVPESSFEDLRVNPTPVEVMPWPDNRAQGEQPRHKNLTGDMRNTRKESNLSKGYCENSFNPAHTTWGTLKLVAPQQEGDALLFARHSVTVIEQLEGTITSLLAPVICVHLLGICVHNIVLLIFLDSHNEGTLLKSLMSLSGGMIQAYFLVDAPTNYRRKCDKIREKLRRWSLHTTSPSLLDKVYDELAESKMKVADMLGLFRLGRHCVLPVVSFITTYFVILLQFRASETSQTLRAEADTSAASANMNATFN